MLKKIAIYVLSFGLLFVLVKLAHIKTLEALNITLGFSLTNVYLFHAIFSLLVCMAFSVLANKEKWFDQLGFIYLVVLVVKIAVFFAVFYSSVFSSGKIPKTDSVSLLIPTIVFIITEVYFVAQILNSKNS